MLVLANFRASLGRWPRVLCFDTLISGLERGSGAPKGLRDSARGFNPRNLPPRRRALKGRRRARSIPPDLAPPNQDQSPVDVHAETGGQDIVFLTLLGQSIWRPFRVRWGLGRFPGLKPRAESCSPFGAKTPRLFQLPSLPRRQREQFRNTLFWGFSIFVSDAILCYLPCPSFELLSQCSKDHAQIA